MRTACLAVFFIAAPFWAQAQEKAPTVDDIAAASGHAARLIAAADGESFFENITQDATPTVRHRPSGMICAFSDENYDRITVYPTGPAGVAQGDDVGCNTRILDVDVTTYATRYAQRYDEAFILNDSLAAIKARWPEATPHSADLITASAEGAKSPLIGGYDILVQDRKMLTLVLVTHQGEWSFKGRVTGPAEGETPTNMLGAMAFLMSLPEQGEHSPARNVQGRRPDAPE